MEKCAEVRQREDGRYEVVQDGYVIWCGRSRETAESITLVRIQQSPLYADQRLEIAAEGMRRAAERMRGLR